MGRFERNPGPTISASLHSKTLPRPSSLTLNFFSPEKSAGLDLIAATRPGRQNPSTHLTVTLAPIIDLFGILFVLAISKNFSVSRFVGAARFRECQKSASAPAKDPCDWCRSLCCWLVHSPPSRRRLLRLFTPPDFTPHPALTDRPAVVPGAAALDQLISLTSPDAQELEQNSVGSAVTGRFPASDHMCGSAGGEHALQDSTTCDGRGLAAYYEYYALCRRSTAARVASSIPTAASFRFHPPGG